MEKMLRTFLLILITLSLTGTSVSQATALVTTHSSRAEFLQITICAADQPPVTILIDRNGNKVPEPVECDCTNCMNCLTGSAFKLPDNSDAFSHDGTVILTIIPLSFDHTGAALIAPATARAPPHKV